MLKKTVLVVFGTRPEAIKMAPLVHAFKAKQDSFNVKVCVTGQHRQMLDQVLNFFAVVPDYDLNLMKPGQSLYHLTADVIVNMKEVLEDCKPDYVFVHGDTTTSTAAAIAAFYNQSSVCHVEAGLRTYNKYSPFPEELNRQMTSRIAAFHFAPTTLAEENLLKENVSAQEIFVTGNTVIDALLFAAKKVEEINDPEIERLKTVIDPAKKMILVTGHRRENFGEGFINICQALLEVAGQPDVQIIYPVHLNPNVQKPVNEYLSNHPNIHLIDPLGYPAFIWLMKRSSIILTDSGGIQEEAPSLNKPVLVMRNNTERPEAVAVGAVSLVGTDRERIVKEVVSLLDAAREKGGAQNKRTQINPYGDGNACGRIVDIILKKQ